MLAIHDQFTQQMRNRLSDSVMGLGLARLLQDAGRVEEAREILVALEYGVADSVMKENTPQRKSVKAQPSTVAEGTSYVAATLVSAGIRVAPAAPHLFCIS